MGKLMPEPVAWLVVYHTLAGQSPEWIAAALLLSASTVYKIRGLVFVLIDPSQVVPSCCDGYIPLPLSSFLSHPFSPAHASLLLASLSRIICTEPSLISKRALSHIHFAIRYIPSALQGDIAYAFSIACNQHGIALHVSYASHACSVVVHIACCVVAFCACHPFTLLLCCSRCNSASPALSSSRQHCVVHSFC